MPFLYVKTNIPLSAVPADFASKLSSVVSQLTGKSEQRVFVEVSAGLLMSNSGSDEPTAVAKLNSIGAISRVENKKSAAALTSAISQNLGIQPNRIMVLFKNLTPEDTSIGGTLVG